jgi:hypothetical protein
MERRFIMEHNVKINALVLTGPAAFIVPVLATIGAAAAIRTVSNEVTKVRQKVADKMNEK